MSACEECSAPLGEDARFCSACGASADADSQDGYQLLGATTGSPLVQDAGVEPNAGRNKVYAVVGACLIGLLLFALTRSPGPDPDDPENAALLPEGSEDAEDSEDEEDDDDETSSTTRRTTTTRRSTTSEPEAQISYIGDGAPLLGEETGWYLFLGSDSSYLKRVDLDTGEVVQYQQRLFPSYAEGEYLVATSESTGTGEVLLIDDPSVDTGVRLDTGYYYPGAISFHPGPEPGQVWTLSHGDRQPRWNLVRLSDGEVLQELEVPTDNFYGPTALGPTVSGASSGGVFELRDGSYVRVAEGSIIAVSRDYVLVEDCLTPVDCDLGWLDRETWEKVDRGIPDERPGWAWLSDDGRVLSFYGYNGGSVFDVERDVLVTAVGEDVERMSVSPDGRFLVSTNGAIRIHNLDTGDIVTLDGVSLSSWGSTLFVEKP